MDKVNNPYRITGLQGQPAGWKWRDENGRPCKQLYRTEFAAQHDLLRYMKRLPWWKRAWGAMKCWRAF